MTHADQHKAEVLTLSNDRLTYPALEAAIRSEGASPVLLEDVAGLWGAMARWPALVLIDMDSISGWQATIRRARSLPEGRAIPVVAYTGAKNDETLQAAREAGCTHAWPRARLESGLPALLQRVLKPTPQAHAACDAPAPALLVHGVEQFNAGEFWECHETLETLWHAEPGEIRALYQGLLQVGLAFYHLLAGNRAGALKMFRRGLPRLRQFPDRCHGLHVGPLAQVATRIHWQVVEEPGRKWQLEELPRLEWSPDV